MNSAPALIGRPELVARRCKLTVSTLMQLLSYSRPPADAAAALGLLARDLVSVATIHQCPVLSAQCCSAGPQLCRSTILFASQTGLCLLHSYQSATISGVKTAGIQDSGPHLVCACPCPYIGGLTAQ